MSIRHLPDGGHCGSPPETDHHLASNELNRVFASGLCDRARSSPSESRNAAVPRRSLLDQQIPQNGSVLLKITTVSYLVHLMWQQTAEWGVLHAEEGEAVRRNMGREHQRAACRT